MSRGVVGDAPDTANANAMPHADDVRLKYLEARRDEHTFEAMKLARQVAEAVCEALGGEMPEQKQTAYRGTLELNTRIRMLEEAFASGAVRIPSAILAALRTLQVYGNYAVHYQKGERNPPPRAAASAMASLALVAQWFLSASVDDLGSSTDGPELRAAAPGAPTFFERRRILRSTRIERITEVEIDSNEPADVQLASLLKYYAMLTKAAEGICRAVLVRETTMEVAGLRLEQLAILFAQVADKRPRRIPRSASASVDEVVRRRALVLRAIRDDCRDVEPFRLEARQGDPIDALVSWFERDYLGKTKLERHWRAMIFVPLGAYIVLGIACSGGRTDGRSARDRELRERFCSAPSGLASSDLCQALAPKPVATTTSSARN